jgi:hypothetical protein
LEEKEMAEEAKKYIYFKRNVPYTVIVRYSERDRQGFALNNGHPVVSVPADRIRDFKMANKQFIMDGIIMETEEPNIDWITPNALTEEDMDELLKNYLKLKSTLAEMNSAPIVNKLLERAKEQNKAGKTIGIIQARFEELSENDEVIIERNEMRGVV